MKYTRPKKRFNAWLFAVIISTTTSVKAETKPAAGALPFVEGSDTLVVLPDTEVYANKKPALFEAQFKWIAQNIAPRNIVSVLHVGDITNNNTEREWQVARKCYDLIEGKVPYVLAAGNHDYDHTPGRLSLMNDVFKVSELKKWPNFGDVYEPDKLENHYQFVKIHKRTWIVLSLEMGPRNAVIEWADGVLKQHRNRPAIILTHGYMYYGNQRYDHNLGSQRASPHGFYGEGADGEELWNKLIRKHANVMMVICGHLSSGYLGYRADEADYGNIVHQMMVDYEKMKSGGMGYLRLLEFLPDDKTIQVRTYSPVTKGTNPRDPKLEEFQFTLQGPTRKTPREIAAGPTAPLSKAPVHRFSFNRPVSSDNKIQNTIGDKHGELKLNDSTSHVDQDGRLVLTGGGQMMLPPDMLGDSEDASFEAWFAATGEKYNWAPAIYFGDGGGDRFWYVFRNLGTHRAEISVNGHNEDIQRSVPVESGKIMHIVVTYDHDGANGQPQLSYYRDGKSIARMRVSLKLTDVSDTHNTIGPFEGIFDELRIYDYALSEEEARGNYNAGAERLIGTFNETPR